MWLLTWMSCSSCWTPQAVTSTSRIQETEATTATVWIPGEQDLVDKDRPGYLIVPYMAILALASRCQSLLAHIGRHSWLQRTTEDRLVNSSVRKIGITDSCLTIGWVQLQVTLVSHPRSFWKQYSNITTSCSLSSSAVWTVRYKTYATLWYLNNLGCKFSETTSKGSHLDLEA